MKALPLYIGAVLIAAAIAGAVVSLLELTPAPAPVVVSAPEPPAPEPVVDVMSPDEVRAQDEEDIMEILLAQIRDTPADIDPAWLQDFCAHICDSEQLAAFWSEVVENGRKYDAQYTALHGQERVVLSRNPLYYVFEAREFIHTQEPSARKLRKQARGLLEMAVYRSWSKSLDEARKVLAKQQRRKPADVEVPDEMGFVEDEVKTSYFKETLRLYELLAELAVEAGENPREFTPDRVRLHEAAIVDRHLGALKMTRQARERYSQTSQSAQPARVAIARWTRAVDEHLLALGRLYIEEAQNEKTFRNKQQEFARRGFQALAMVYQRSHSGEALRVLREANRIQRYNLWQSARVAWKQAREAVAAGRHEEATDEFFRAKQRYLQCLTRVERSKKPIVLEEYKRLQAEINTWMASRGQGVVAAAEG